MPVRTCLGKASHPPTIQTSPTNTQIYGPPDAEFTIVYNEKPVRTSLGKVSSLHTKKNPTLVPLRYNILFNISI
jgi:hypothetical protein